MAVIKDDDIIGYFIGEKIVCRSCIGAGEKKGITADDVITEHDISAEDRYFCDRCQKEILAL